MTETAELYREIGGRIQQIRKRLGLLQKDFAEALDISTSAISDMEAGNIKPRFDLLYNISLVYNVNLHYLLHGKGMMFQPEEGHPVYEMDRFPEHREWMSDFLYHFNHSPMVRYTMMSYFITYKNEHDLLIAKDMEKSKGKDR